MGNWFCLTICYSIAKRFVIRLQNICYSIAKYLLLDCKIFVIRLQNVSRGVRVSETCVIKHQPAKDVAFYFLKILFQKDPNKEVVMGRFAFLCLCCPLSVFS